MRKVVEEGADLGIAWDGDADRCFFIDDTGAFVDGDFLTALLAESAGAQGPAARRSSTTCAPRARVARHRRAARRDARCPTASATRSSRRACARRTRSSAARSRGHYYFRDFYCADSGHDPGAADARAALGRAASALSELARALPLDRTSSPARSTPRSPTPTRRWPRSRRTYAERGRARSATSTASASTSTTGTSTCARRTPSRCCACAWSRSSPWRTWSAAATRCSR